MKGTRVIILCGGNANRWNNYLGVPKQLIKIDGMTLLDRAIDQVRTIGVSDVHVIGNNPEFARAGTQYHNCKKEPFASQMFHKVGTASPVWNRSGITVILFGDVWYSSTTIKMLFQQSDGFVTFVGRLFPSSVTGCDYGEMFGLNFGPEMHSVIQNGIGELPEPEMTTSRLYNVLRSQLQPNFSSNVVLINIDDATEDFDFPVDYDRWLKNRDQQFAIDQSRKGFQLDDWVKVMRRKWQRRLYWMLPSTAIMSFCLGFLFQMTLD